MKTNLYIFVLLLLLWPFSVFAESDEKVELNSASELQEDQAKSIREIKDDLVQLDVEKDDLSSRLSSLKQESDLNALFREGLSNEDLKKIKEIMDVYKVYTAKLNDKLAQESKEFKLTTETKNQLLNERKVLYKGLIHYIDPSMTDEYLEYIKADALILKESKDVKEEYHRKTEILNNKVEVVREKIKEHNKYLSKKLEKLVSEKLDEKINNLKLNEKFKLLDNEFKLSVLDKTILSVESKIVKLKESTFSSSFILKKIGLYELALEKIKILRLEYLKVEEL